MLSKTFKAKQGTKKILVVDDDRTITMFLTNILKRDGYEVVTAADGVECIAQAEAELPDLILLDYVMPNMNGAAALAKLRASNKTADIPVIMVTASVDDENVLRAQKSGATNFIAKPIDRSLLLKRITEVLKKGK